MWVDFVQVLCGKVVRTTSDDVARLYTLQVLAKKCKEGRGQWTDSCWSGRECIGWDFKGQYHEVDCGSMHNISWSLCFTCNRIFPCVMWSLNNCALTAVIWNCQSSIPLALWDESGLWFWRCIWSWSYQLWCKYAKQDHDIFSAIGVVAHVLGVLPTCDIYFCVSSVSGCGI